MSILGEAIERVVAQRKAIALFNSLKGGGDAEADHSAADDALPFCVPADVREAYLKARARCGFWYS